MSAYMATTDLVKTSIIIHPASIPVSMVEAMKVRLQIDVSSLPLLG